MSDLKNSAVIGFCTVSDRETGKKIARTIVNEKLAACGNILPNVTSIYRWQGEVQEDHELLLIIKTKKQLVEELQARIKALHPYDTPEIVFFPITHGLPAYLQWIQDVTINR